MSSLKDASHQKWNFHGSVPDAPLRELARKFLKLSPFPGCEAERGDEYLQDGTPLKHLSKFPGMQKWAVKHYIAGKIRCIAFANANQIDDAMRFADATTLRFWRYRIRTADVMCESQFNFSIAAAKADLEDWQDSAPEVMSLIDEIESHFLEAGLFVDPAKRAEQEKNPHSVVARRTVRGELRSMSAEAAHRHQEILDYLAAFIEAIAEDNKKTTECISDLCDKVNSLQNKLDNLEVNLHRRKSKPGVSWEPSDPFADNVGPNPMFSTSTGDPVPAVTISEAPASIFIPPLTGEVRIILQEPPYTK